MKIIFLFFPLLFSSFTYATYFSEIAGYSGTTSNQNKILLTDLLFEKNKSNLFWPYQKETQSSLSFGMSLSNYDLSGPFLSFRSLNAQVFTAYRLNSKHKIHLNLGGQHITQQDQSIESQFFIGGLKYESQWTENLSSEFSFDRKFLFPLVVPLNNDPRSLYSSVFQFNLNWKIFNDYDLQLKNRFNFINDNNQSSDTDFQAMYAFQRYPHWLRLGLGGQYFSYQNASTSYWAPERFVNWGPRLDVSYSVYEQFQCFLGGSYNFFKENDFKSGHGFYLKTGLQYGDRNKFLAVFAFEKNQSIQNGQIWNGDGLSLNLNAFW